jgi:RND family efflux transporter MFP subunit
MINMKQLLRKKALIGGAIVILIAILVFVLFQNKGDEFSVEEKVMEVEMIKVADYQNGLQSITAYGQIESMNQVDLRSQVSGTLKAVNVKIGDRVERGQLLAEIDHDVLDVQLDQAKATVDRLKSGLDLKVAGATDEQKDVANKQVEAAQVSYDKSKESLEDTISLADKSLSVKYSNALSTLSDLYIKIYNSYNYVDSLTDTYFNKNDQGSIKVENLKKYKIETSMNSVKTSIDNAKSTNKEADIDKAIDDTYSAVKVIADALAEIREVCNKSEYPVTTADKSTLDSHKSIMSGAQTSLTGIKSDISLTRTQNEANIASVQARVDSAKAALDLQKASYNSVIADPRDVDLEGINYSIKEAEAAYRLIATNRDKAFIRAPFSGTVSAIPSKENSLISSGQVVVSLVNKDGLQVKGYVADKEKSLIENGAEVKIEGGINGIVSNISPSINDTTKKVEVIIAITDENAPLTIGEYVEADIMIKKDLSGSDNFLLPLKAIKFNAEKAYVCTVKDGLVEEKEVKTGNVINESIEVLGGLSMEDEIAASSRGLKAGEKVKIKEK